MRGPRPRRLIDYRWLVDALSEGAVCLDAKGRVLYCNRAFATLLGRARDSNTGTAFASLVSAKERHRIAAFLNLSRGATVKGEFTLRAGRDATVPVHLSVAPLPDFGPGITGMVVTDLTGQTRQAAEDAHKAEGSKRQMMRSLLLARKDERRRIERDLHNEAGQLLTAIKAKLYGIEAAKTLESAQEQARAVLKIASDAMDELRRVAHGLRSPLVEEMGLQTALARYCQEWSEMHNISLRLREKCLGDLRLSPELETGIYRIVQEALTNIVKHAQATAVSVRLVVARPGLRLYVSDNGRGFDLAKALASREHLGLRAMQEQAETLGGRFEIFLKKARGTTAFAQFPGIQRTARLRKARTAAST
ncbi:MAG: histidine kinase [Candidatus Acidiferrales bacterium]